MQTNGNTSGDPQDGSGIENAFNSQAQNDSGVQNGSNTDQVIPQVTGEIVDDSSSSTSSTESSDSATIVVGPLTAAVLQRFINRSVRIKFFQLPCNQPQRGSLLSTLLRERLSGKGSSNVGLRNKTSRDIILDALEVQRRYVSNTLVKPVSENLPLLVFSPIAAYVMMRFRTRGFPTYLQSVVSEAVPGASAISQAPTHWATFNYVDNVGPSDWSQLNKFAFYNGKLFFSFDCSVFLEHTHNYLATFQGKLFKHSVPSNYFLCAQNYHSLLTPKTVKSVSHHLSQQKLKLLGSKKATVNSDHLHYWHMYMYMLDTLPQRLDSIFSPFSVVNSSRPRYFNIGYVFQYAASLEHSPSRKLEKDGSTTRLFNPLNQTFTSLPSIKLNSHKDLDVDQPTSKEKADRLAQLVLQNRWTTLMHQRGNHYRFFHTMQWMRNMLTKSFTPKLWVQNEKTDLWSNFDLPGVQESLDDLYHYLQNDKTTEYSQDEFLDQFGADLYEQFLNDKQENCMDLAFKLDFNQLRSNFPISGSVPQRQFVVMRFSQESSPGLETMDPKFAKQWNQRHQLNQKKSKKQLERQNKKQNKRQAKTKRKAGGRRYLVAPRSTVFPTTQATVLGRMRDQLARNNQYIDMRKKYGSLTPFFYSYARNQILPSGIPVQQNFWTPSLIEPKVSRIPVFRSPEKLLIETQTIRNSIEEAKTDILKRRKSGYLYPDQTFLEARVLAQPWKRFSNQTNDFNPPCKCLNYQVFGQPSEIYRVFKRMVLYPNLQAGYKMASKRELDFYNLPYNDSWYGLQREDYGVGFYEILPEDQRKDKLELERKQKPWFKKSKRRQRKRKRELKKAKPSLRFLSAKNELQREKFALRDLRKIDYRRNIETSDPALRSTKKQRLEKQAIQAYGDKMRGEVENRKKQFHQTRRKLTLTEFKRHFWVKRWGYRLKVFRNYERLKRKTAKWYRHTAFNDFQFASRNNFSLNFPELSERDQRKLWFEKKDRTLAAEQSSVDDYDPLFTRIYENTEDYDESTHSVSEDFVPAGFYESKWLANNKRYNQLRQSFAPEFQPPKGVSDCFSRIPHNLNLRAEYEVIEPWETTALYKHGLEARSAVLDENFHDEGLVNRFREISRVEMRHWDPNEWPLVVIQFMFFAMALQKAHKLQQRYALALYITIHEFCTYFRWRVLTHLTTKNKMVFYPTTDTRLRHVIGIDSSVVQLVGTVLYLRNQRKRFLNIRPSFPQPDNAFGFKKPYPPNSLSTDFEINPTKFLLVGPPGTGKTFLVKALAGEAQVPVVVFGKEKQVLRAEDYQGYDLALNALQINSLFQVGREEAPCIIFIDEIDAYGPDRKETLEAAYRSPFGPKVVYNKHRIIQNNAFYQWADRLSYGHPGFNLVKTNIWHWQVVNPTASNMVYNERVPVMFKKQHTNSLSMRDLTPGTEKKSISKGSYLSLTQLLCELDGLTSKKMVVIAATNRPRALDPALVRPGRLSTVLYMDLPNTQKRFELLQFFSENKLSEPIDWQMFAQKTTGLSPAHLRAAMNMSAMRSIYKDSCDVTFDSSQRPALHSPETVKYGLQRVLHWSPQHMQLLRKVHRVTSQAYPSFVYNGFEGFTNITFVLRRISEKSLKAIENYAGKIIFDQVPAGLDLKILTDLTEEMQETAQIQRQLLVEKGKASPTLLKAPKPLQFKKADLRKKFYESRSKQVRRERVLNHLERADLGTEGYQEIEYELNLDNFLPEDPESTDVLVQFLNYVQRVFKFHLFGAQLLIQSPLALRHIASLLPNPVYQRANNQCIESNIHFARFTQYSVITQCLLQNQHKSFFDNQPMRKTQADFLDDEVFLNRSAYFNAGQALLRSAFTYKMHDHLTFDLWAMLTKPEQDQTQLEFVRMIYSQCASQMQFETYLYNYVAGKAAESYILARQCCPNQSNLGYMDVFRVNWLLAIMVEKNMFYNTNLDLLKQSAVDGLGEQQVNFWATQEAPPLDMTKSQEERDKEYKKHILGELTRKLDSKVHPEAESEQRQWWQLEMSYGHGPMDLWHPYYKKTAAKTEYDYKGEYYSLNMVNNRISVQADLFKQNQESTQANVDSSAPKEQHPILRKLMQSPGYAIFKQAWPNWNHKPVHEADKLKLQILSETYVRVLDFFYEHRELLDHLAYLMLTKGQIEETEFVKVIQQFSGEAVAMQKARQKAMKEENLREASQAHEHENENITQPFDAQPFEAEGYSDMCDSDSEVDQALNSEKGDNFGDYPYPYDFESVDYTEGEVEFLTNSFAAQSYEAEGCYANFDRVVKRYKQEVIGADVSGPKGSAIDVSETKNQPSTDSDAPKMLKLLPAPSESSESIQSSVESSTQPESLKSSPAMPPLEPPPSPLFGGEGGPPSLLAPPKLPERPESPEVAATGSPSETLESSESVESPKLLPPPEPFESVEPSQLSESVESSESSQTEDSMQPESDPNSNSSTTISPGSSAKIEKPWSSKAKEGNIFLNKIYEFLNCVKQISNNITNKIQRFLNKK